MERIDGGPEAPRDLPAGDLTEILSRWDAADSDARGRLVELVYPHLKRIAKAQMHRERFEHTLQPTALVNEFYLLLARQRDFNYKDRVHFLAVASRAMRRLLIDYARSRNAEKGSGRKIRVPIDSIEFPDLKGPFEILAIDEALQRLAAEDPRMAKVVEFKCYGGLTFVEIAEVLGINERTAKRDWQVARAWLFGQLQKGSPDAGK